MKDAILTDLAAYCACFPKEAGDQNRLRALLADGSDYTSRKNMTGHITSSALVLNPAQDKVLLIHHIGMDKWMQPGGHFEGPGDRWDSAQREVLEETGVGNIRLHPWHDAHPFPFDMDTHPIAARPAKNEGDHYHHDSLYLAIAAEEKDLSAQLEEVHGAVWAPLAKLRVLDPRLQRLHDKLEDALKA